MTKAVIQLFLLIALPAVSVAKATKEFTLITHETRPYMSPSMPEQGAFIYGLRKILKKKNYTLKVVFAPSWIRAKINAEKDPKISGYGPARTIENTDKFDFTNFDLKSPWVIIERKDKPIVWNKVEDLAKYVAGSVQGVELRPGIKELVDAGKMTIETTTSQTHNLQKLATKRVDFVFSDVLTFQYLMSTEDVLKPFRDQLRVNDKVFSIDRYGVALKKSKDNQELIKHINAHANDFNKYIEEYLSTLPEGQHSKDHIGT